MKLGFCHLFLLTCKTTLTSEWFQTSRDKSRGGHTNEEELHDKLMYAFGT